MQMEEQDVQDIPRLIRKEFKKLRKKRSGVASNNNNNNNNISAAEALDDDEGDDAAGGDDAGARTQADERVRVDEYHDMLKKSPERSNLLGKCLPNGNHT